MDHFHGRFHDNFQTCSFSRFAPDVCKTVKRLVYLLKQHGADFGIQDSHTNTPLMAAIFHEASTCFIRWLFNVEGMVLTGQHNVPWSFRCLALAAMYGHPNLLELMLKTFSQIDVNFKPAGWGHSVVRFWCHDEGTVLLDCLRALTKRGIDINSRDQRGQTLLHKGIQEEIKNYEELLQIGRWDLEARDNQGLTPLALARREGKYDFVQALMRHGAKDIEEDYSGRHALVLTIVIISLCFLLSALLIHTFWT